MEDERRLDEDMKLEEEGEGSLMDKVMRPEEKFLEDEEKKPEDKRRRYWRVRGCEKYNVCDFRSAGDSVPQQSIIALASSEEEGVTLIVLFSRSCYSF